MSKYTVLLKSLMESDESKEKLNQALSSYPLYQPENISIPNYIPTREELNKKILNFYKYREIAFETPGRFIDELEISMNEIMPFYNQMFESVYLMTNIEDIFGNVNVTETFEEKRKGITTGSNSNESSISNSENSTSNVTTNQEDQSSNTTSATDKQTASNNMTDASKKVYTDTPQNQHSIPAKSIDTVSAASNVEWNKNESNSLSSSEGENTASSTTESNSTNTSSGSNVTESNSTNTSSGTNESTEDVTVQHTFTKKGNQGVNTYAHDIIEFRQTILNVEQQIINDIRIKELFLMVY